MSSDENDDKDNYERLETLIASGQQEAAVSFMNEIDISEGTFTNIPVNDTQSSPLTVAVSNGMYEVTEYLLDNGLDFIHICNMPPVHCAAIGGHLQIIHLLVEYGYGLDDPDYKNDSPLYMAAHHNQEVIIRFLLEAGCNVNHVNFHKDTILHRLIEKRASIDILECFFSKGFSKINFLNYMDVTPLMWALMCERDVEVINFLLSKGASVLINNRLDQTTFQVAVDYIDDVDILRVLFVAGACPECHSSRTMSPLVMAVNFKKMNFVRFLVKEVNVTMFDRFTETGYSDAFMMALREKRLDIALFLLQSGYDVSYSQRLRFQQSIGDLEIIGPDAKDEIETISLLMSNARSLKDICARFLRQRFGHDIFYVMVRIQLPSVLVNYVLLEHL